MRPKRFISIPLALLLTFAAAARADAQQAQTEDPEQQPATRPLGLVLSGGGARGGAHLGVIMALEELRVPIDYIAGTSIGSAIGGLYASGMSVAELQEFLEDIDWDAAFLNVTPRRLRSFRRKRDDDLFLVDQRPGLNEGQFELPTGVVQGQVIDTIMARVTLPVTGVMDFDELAIPFRAVAGDLETGDAVVLGGGNLGRAIRASMTVPTLLAPIEIDGRLLVDGGIAMNLPVEVAQEMGARAIVAIDISEPLSTRDELRSVVSVTAQLSSLLTRRGLEEQRALLAPGDVLIRPEFTEEQSSLSFGRITETVQVGYDAIMANRAALERFALTPEEYAAHRRARIDPREEELPTIDFVRLNNNSPIADRVLEARMTDVEIGVPLDVDALETSLNRLYGLELYQNIRYEVVEDDEGTGLELDVIERSWGPNYIQLGAEYSSASHEDALFGLAASYLRTAVNERGGEWRATVFLGDEPSFLIDSYQPVGAKALFFVAPGLSVESNQLNVFSNGDLIGEVKLREAEAEIGIGRELMDWGEIRFGLRSGYGDTRLRVGDPSAVPFEDFHSGELFTRFSIDTFDNISFPREGLLATAEWRGSKLDRLSADATYDQVLLEGAIARTWGRHTLVSTVRYDATVSGTAPMYRLNRIGGFFDLAGLNNQQLSGQHVARIGANYYRRIGDLALLPAFAGISVEVGNAWDVRSDISMETAIWGGSLWAGVDSPVGPVYIGYGFAEGGDNAFYVFLGRVF